MAAVLARSFAGLSLLAMAVAVIGTSVTRFGITFGHSTDSGTMAGTYRADPSRLARHAATLGLLLGVAAFVIQSFVLCMRLIYTGVDLLNGFPDPTRVDHGYSAEGIGTLALVASSCAVGLIGTGDRRLFTCQLWITVAIGVWVCLSVPVFATTGNGAFLRTPSTLVLLACMSVLMAIYGWVGLWFERTTPGAPTLPGLRASCTALTVAILLLVTYHLAVPVLLNAGSHRVSFLTVGSSAALVAGTAVWMGGGSRLPHLIDLGLVLASLALGSWAAMMVPTFNATLAEMYPMFFTAILVGCGAGGALWIHVAKHCRRAVKSGAGTSLHAWLVPRARRSAFLSLAIGLLLSTLLAVWPRLPSIAAMDDSLGRVAAGLAANMFVLLVTVWGARVLRGYSFQALSLMSVAATGGFVVVRMILFTSRFG